MKKILCYYINKIVYTFSNNAFCTKINIEKLKRGKNNAYFCSIENKCN